jgi:hypothetical protein
VTGGLAAKKTAEAVTRSWQMFVGPLSLKLFDLDKFRLKGANLITMGRFLFLACFVPPPNFLSVIWQEFLPPGITDS